MKHLIFYIFLISSVSSVFSQKKFIKSFYRGDDGIQYFIKPIVYQTVKKERLKILNKKFDGSGKFWVKVNNTSSARPNIYTKYWNEVLFEMDIETGQITEQSESNITIDAD
jgi:hypothetical protein